MPFSVSGTCSTTGTKDVAAKEDERDEKGVWALPLNSKVSTFQLGHVHCTQCSRVRVSSLRWEYGLMEMENRRSRAKITDSIFQNHLSRNGNGFRSVATRREASTKSKSQVGE